MVEREEVRVPAAQLRAGDRFANGWVVKSARLMSSGRVAYFTGKSGYRGQHPHVTAPDVMFTVSRKVVKS